MREHLDAAGWEPTEGDDWALWWGSGLPPASIYQALTPGRFVNHFPGIHAITRKDTLAWALELARLGRDAGPRFHPETWILPEDHAAFLRDARRSPDALYIEKPVAWSNGRGIRMVTDPASVRPEPGRLVQRYLSRPHLLDGYKYTLRCYVAVTSMDPVEAWLFHDGFTKLTSRPFTTDRAALADRLVHLTNPEVQRENAAQPISGRNLTHVAYREHLRASGVDVDALWARIGAIAAETVRAGSEFATDCSARILRAEHGRTFELLGLDVLVDDRLQPWVVECNLGPSLAVEASPTTPSAVAEHDVKRRVVRDLLRVAGVLPQGAEPNGFERIA